MHLDDCKERLYQGDVYHLSVALPWATPGVVTFDLERQAIAGAGGPQSPQYATIERVSRNDGTFCPRSSPGEARPSPNEEYLVIAGAEIIEYFLVASSTCDVSGDGKLESAYIVPFQPLGRTIESDTLPIDQQEMTILEYFQSRHQVDFSDITDPDFQLPSEIRTLITDLTRGATGSQAKTLSAVKKFFCDKLCSPKGPKWLYYLPPLDGYAVPEGFADLRKICRMEVELLESLRERRVASLAGSYREHFGRQVGDFLSRVAVLMPLAPPKL